MSTQLPTTQERLAAYLDAEAKILRGQSVQMDGEQVDFADLEAVQKEIRRLQRQVTAEKRAAAGGGRAGVALADFNDWGGSGRCGR